ncbi:MAG: hypothetical protein ACOX2I_14130 [Candidatus Ozemobacteraceae bacterium]
MNNINEIKDIFYTSSEIVEFKHFRVSIFASYSSDKVIDDSVVFYLKELIFCNDSVYGPYYPKNEFKDAYKKFIIRQNCCSYALKRHCQKKKPRNAVFFLLNITC